MVYLHEPQILFIRPKKVASTVMDFAFAKNSKSIHDIITPDDAAIEIERLKRDIPIPQNWGVAPGTNSMYASLLFELNAFLLRNELEHSRVAEIKKELEKLNHGKRDYYEHIPLKEIAKKLKGFSSITKITVVRHPYEFVVSYAAMRFRRNNYNSFESAIDGEIYKERESNDRFYFLNGKKACDIYLRYEHLLDDISKLEQTHPVKLYSFVKKTHLRHTHRENREPARNILTERQKKDIQKLFAKQFQEFNYEY